MESAHIEREIASESERKAVGIRAAMECRTDNISRVANTLRRVLDLSELPQLTPGVCHIKDAEDIFFGIRPLVTEWAFRELRDALALVFAAAEHFHECNRQLDHAEKMDALRDQSKEELERQ